MSAPAITAVGDGMVVKYGTDSANITTTLLGILNVKTPKYVSPEVDTTLLADVADQSQGGRVKSSDMVLDLKENATQGAALLAFQLAKTSLYWTVTPVTIGTFGNNASASSVLTFVGWIKEFQPVGDGEANKQLTTPLTVSVSGTLSLG